jgi:hypothetical protein
VLLSKIVEILIKTVLFQRIAFNFTQNRSQLFESETINFKYTS